MPGTHAPLGPSSAVRWISCPASVRLCADMSEDSSDYADEGTAAHAYAEILARRELLGVHRAADLILWHRAHEETFSREEFQDLQRHANAYVDLLRERLGDAGDHASLLLERRVDTGIPGCTGTADAIVLAPGYVEVVDFKFGAGDPVSAIQNPQVMLYGVGALELADLFGDVETVGMTIFQPRVGDGATSTWFIDADELREWRDGLRPVAAEALAGSDRFGPSVKACKWCRVSGECRAQADAATDAVFGVPLDAVDVEAPEVKTDLLDPEELAKAMELAPFVRQWALRVEGATLDHLTTGREVPGWKAVLSRGRRTITDEALAVARLREAGFSEEEVRRSELRPFGELEKLVGKKELEPILGDAIGRTEGKPSVVRESDKRKAIANVMDLFDEPEE